MIGLTKYLNFGNGHTKWKIARPNILLTITTPYKKSLVHHSIIYFQKNINRRKGGSSQFTLRIFSEPLMSRILHNFIKKNMDKKVILNM